MPEGTGGSGCGSFGLMLIYYVHRHRRRGGRWPSTVHVEPTAPAAAPSPPAAAPRRTIPSLVILGPPASGVSASAAPFHAPPLAECGGAEGCNSHLNSRPTVKSRPTDRIDPRRRDGCAHRVMGYSWSQSRRSGAAWLASYCRRTEGVDKSGGVFRRRPSSTFRGALVDEKSMNLHPLKVHPGQFECAEHDGGG